MGALKTIISFINVTINIIITLLKDNYCPGFALLPNIKQIKMKLKN